MSAEPWRSVDFSAFSGFIISHFLHVWNNWQKTFIITGDKYIIIFTHPQYKKNRLLISLIFIEKMPHLEVSFLHLIYISIYLKILKKLPVPCLIVCDKNFSGHQFRLFGLIIAVFVIIIYGMCMVLSLPSHQFLITHTFVFCNI